MTYAQHGGACCGYKHLYGLDRMSVDAFDRALTEHFIDGNNNRVLEVILSARQVASPPTTGDNRFHPTVVEAGGWPSVLAARGFVLSAVWNNSNSSNVCYQFLKTTTFLDNTATPFWNGERITLRPPNVTVVGVNPLTAGMTVRHRRSGRLGTIERLSSPTVARVNWRTTDADTAPGTTTGHIENLEEVIIQEVPAGAWRRELGFPPPAPVDPNREMEVVGEDGTSRPFTMTARHAGGEIISGRAVEPLRTRDNRDLSTTYDYLLRTGEWYGMQGQNIGRIRNTLPTVQVAAPATIPALTPTVVLTEYFAVFANGNRRGPFINIEGIRDAYPRVRSFATRRVLSDGTVQEETGALPR